MNIWCLVIHYGSKALTDKCLASIRNSKRTDFQLKTLVINNTQENLGYGGGANKGIKEILKDKNNQYILLLNNDLVLQEEAIINLLEAFKDPLAGIAGPKTFLNKNNLEYLGPGVIDKNRFTAGHSLIKNKNNQENIIEADFVSGSAMLIKSGIFAQTGLFDERFFLYYEDVDFCFRVKKRGYKCLFVPDSTVIHQGSASVQDKDKAYYLARNHLFFVKKNAPIKIRIRECLRLPKTLYEHLSKYYNGGKEAILGIKDYFVRKSGKREIQIGLDVGALKGGDNPSGVYRTTVSFLTELEKSGITSKFIRYQPEYFSLFWTYFELPIRLFKDKPATYLGLSQSLPHFFPGKKIVVFYDLAFEYFPQFYPGNKRLSKQSQYAAKAADKIIAVSQKTKQDLIDFYQIEEEKIKVIYEGIGEEFKPKNHEGVAKIRKKYNLDNVQYLLFVGQNRPIKNINFLLKLFKEVKKELPDLKLIIAGTGFDNLKNPGVVFLGKVKEEDLPFLYSGAEAFVLTSFYEGFGLPLLEAMACGCPVIASNVGSVPEVVGNAGILIEQNNLKDFKEAIISLIQNKKLSRQLREEGLKQSQKFSWEKFVKAIINLIER